MATSIFKLAWSIVLVVALCSVATMAEEAGAPGPRSITIQGHKSSVITTKAIKLGDIAQISSRLTKDDDAIVALQKIFIQSSPKPGSEATISAAEILEKLKSAGVSLGDLGYLLPKIMAVKRASRVLTREEIQKALEDSLKQSGKEISIKQIQYPNDVHVVPGPTEIEIGLATPRSPGSWEMKVNAKVEGEEPVIFDVSADVNEWKEVPVARRPIQKGELLEADHLMMARLNLSSIPRDAAYDDKEVLGLEVKQGIQYGEVLRKSKLTIPPLIESGARVTLRYKSNLLEATASGVALEDGLLGKAIRVKNDSSKKIITGTVVEPGLVEVDPVWK